MIQNFKKTIIGTLIFLFISSGITAQQDAMYTQYMFNTSSVNAAYAGTKEALNVILLSRHQWMGFEGAPVTQSLTAHMPVWKKKMGVGFSYVRDEIGPLVVNNIFLDFAYKVKVHEGGLLSMGVKAGIDMRENNLTSLSPDDATDPAYYTDVVSNVTPNFGAGLFYYTNKYYLGVSTPKISQTELSTDSNDPNLGREELSRHYFVIAGYVMDINDDWKFKPSGYAKIVKGAPASFDLSLNFMYQSKIIGGTAYRFGDAISFMTQIRIARQWWFGYAFDWSLTRLRTFNNGTHEIMLTLDTNLPKKDIVKSPRFF